jgi:hypothetical protein
VCVCVRVRAFACVRVCVMRAFVCARARVSGAGSGVGEVAQKLFTLLDLCVSSLRRGHANLLCIVPILTDDPRRESNSPVARKCISLGT